MIPVKLTIQGLYSYQERQIIDFGKLTGAGLFGIFGAVGSGKSSVLEAITFALYGKTDRLNLSGDNRNYNMMNLKSTELLIDFEFETGKEQTAYRAIVKGKRNSKKFDDVKTLERMALRFENKTWIPVEPEALEKAIGLSYDNFKRTIIIPQGQFQEFLQLGNKDRTQMMKELFGLEKFELYGKTVALENTNNEKIQNLHGQLHQLGAFDAAQQLILQNQLEELKTNAAQLSLELKEKSQLETQLKQLKELFAQKEELTKKLALQHSQLPEIEQLEKKITDFEYCLIHFKPMLDNLNSSSQKILVIEKKTGEESATLKQIETQIIETENQFNGVKTDFENRDKLRRKADELDKMLRLAELRELIETAEKRLKNGEEITLKTIQQIDLYKQEKEKLEAGLKTEKEAQPDMKALSDARSWHEILSALNQQLDSTATDYNKAKTGIETAHADLSSILENAFFTDFSGEKSFTEAMLFLKQKEEKLKQQITETEDEIRHLKVQQKLETFATGLKEGEACPVCGSLHHPSLLTTANVEEMLKLAENKKSLLENEVQNGEKFSRKIAEQNNLILITQNQIGGIQAKKTEIENKIAAHKKLFSWEKYPTTDAVNKAFEHAELIRKNIEALEKQLGETSTKLEKEVQNREKYQLEIDKIKTKTGRFKTEQQVLTAQIQMIDAEKFASWQKAEIEKEKNRLLWQYADIEKQFNMLNDKLLKFRETKNILSGSIAASQLQLAREKSDLANWNQKLEQELVASDFKAIDTVRQTLGLNLNLAAEKQRITNFRQETALLKDKTEQLAREIGERQYDAETHTQLLEQLEKDKSTLDQINRELGITEKSLADLLKALETQAHLQKKLEQLQLRAENIRTMKSLFKASGFVNYISSVYLQNLCNASNDRFFKLTRQKLSLEITEDNNFQVRDFMNGGKVRSVKTLSGGQTFQAALSLALALADNIQKITESNQNFFFLDEGFGSLDKESLSIVFDTLKSLRHENRIVGVISHVEEMQQEIEVHLQVINSEETGSKIVESWAV